MAADLLMVLIGLTYATVAPLMLPFTVAYFFTAFVVHRYNMVRHLIASHTSLVGLSARLRAVSILSSSPPPSSFLPITLSSLPLFLSDPPAVLP